MTLLILLLICHYIADYTHLSNMWMLKAKAKGTPTFPILCHAGVHALLMCIVLCFCTQDIGLSIGLSYLQWMSHFIIDIWKGRMNVWFPKLADPTYKGHWYIFGFDQLLHQLVILLMVSIAL